MFTSFIERLGGLFDQRFLLAYGVPTFVLVVLTASLRLAQIGVAAGSQWWEGKSATAQALFGLGLLLGMTLTAYLLQAFSGPLIRLYEGYWPRPLRWLQSWGRQAELIQKQCLPKEDQHTRRFGFPNDDQSLMPTRLGNTLRAAEEYPYRIYGIDSVIWWPRLVQVMPTTMQSQVDEALTPLITLLNLCTCFWLWASGGAIYLFWTDQRPWLFVLVLIGGWLAAWGCYGAAIAAAQGYGNAIRVAFDLYRHDILSKLHLPLPDNLYAEQQLWYKLNQLHYHQIFPWELPAAAADDPFSYATDKPAAPTPKPQTLDVNVKGLSTINVRHHGGL